MRKRFILIFFQVLLCILCFLNNWFYDYIINRFIFVTAFICDLILFVLFVVLCFKSFRNLKNENLIYKIVIFCVVIVTIFLSFYDFRFIKTKFELELFDNKRNIIIDKVRNNEFSYYQGKNIKLPIYSYTSSDGEIYVYKNDEDGSVISFWIYRGVMSGSVQLVYSSDDEKLIKDNIKYISKVTKLKKNWYYVTTE